jgi:hypothetical protein
MSTGDLSLEFQAQMGREGRVDGRYRTASRRLDGLPSFTQDDLNEIDLYVRNLTENQRRARITGTEIDAALNDPRWRADVSSDKR